MTTGVSGLKVIIADGECQLARQRRIKPIFARKVKEGQRAVRTRFGIDPDVCTGDHACIRLSGCPSLSLKRLDDPLRDDPVASIDQSCVGCGNCGEVADAAVLCPSFYQADVVHNPGPWERWLSNLSATVIGWLQGRRARGRIEFAEMAE
jgi:indolepyruvate ferredoxin oxidoreductase alpha subunit